MVEVVDTFLEIPLSDGSVLQAGIDDQAIVRLSAINMSNLELAKADDSSFYVVTIETWDKTKSLWVFLPHRVIMAKRMLDAIKLFEADAFGRLWLPISEDPEDCQIGISRMHNDRLHHRSIKIYRMRKDCLLGDIDTLTSLI